MSAHACAKTAEVSAEATGDSAEATEVSAKTTGECAEATGVSAAVFCVDEMVVPVCETAPAVREMNTAVDAEEVTGRDLQRLPLAKKPDCFEGSVVAAIGCIAAIGLVLWRVFGSWLPYKESVHV